MSFRDAVRKRKVNGPNRPGFVVDEWQKHATNLANDDIDRQLAQAGEWFFAKFEEARTKHLLVNDKTVSRTAKLRAVVAGSNIAMLDIQNGFAAHLKRMERSGRRAVLSDEFQYFKQTSLGKVSVPTDDQAESMVGGTQKALRFVLQTRSGDGGKKGSVEGALSDINLGMYYYALESHWERILWEEYELIPGTPATIRPSMYCLLDAFIVTRARQDRLIFGLYQMAGEHFRQGSFHPDNTYVRPVVAIAKDGRRQRMVLGSAYEATSSTISAFVMRHAVRQQYYADIWFAESKCEAGLNLDLVLKAWEVVSTASQVLAERLATQTPPAGKINVNAPVLEIRALCQAIQSTAHVEYRVARRLVDFLTFEGKDKDDLWAKPLVRIADDRVAPVLLTACFPELRRTIDIWLANLEIVVQDKGKVFNRNVQDAIARTAANSKYLNDAIVVSGEFKLPIKKNRIEEIDLLIVLGSLVVVGECKCKVMPNEPRDWHKHRQLVQEAVVQVRRKAQAVMSNIQIFAERLHQRGIVVPAVLEVIPMVVLNTGLHAGLPVDGVPVVDLPLLETYFRGYIANGTVEREDGRLDVIPKLSLYSTALEARQNFNSYLHAPPQLHQLRKSVKDCSIPLPMLDDPGMPMAIFHSREVELDMTRYVLSVDGTRP